MGMTKDELFEILDNGFSESVIEIQDLAGDNDHYAVKIISNEFNGLNKIKQHKLVYDVLGKKMGYTLHALSIKTEVPKE
jgi:stress-induced morphogen